MLYLIYVVAVIIGYGLLYLVMKKAVKDGFIEAQKDLQTNPIKSPLESMREALQKKYDKGEISFDQFQSDWNKLK